LFDSVRHFIVKHTPFESVVTSNDSILNRAPSKKSFFNQKSIFWNKLILASSSVTEIRDTLVCCPDRRVGFVAKGAEEGAQSCVVLQFRWWEEGFADYSMYSTFLTASPGSVLFSRSNLLKRKDLCFSCLRLGLIRHRRSLRSSHLFSSGLTRFCRVTT
jgi:hypothetical protein